MFARCGWRQRFPVFDKAGRHRPKAEAGLDGSPAQENLSLILGYAADEQAGVLIVEGPAGIANVSMKVGARRDAQLVSREASR